MLTRMANDNAAKWLGGTSWLDLGTVEGGVPCDIFLSGSWGLNQDGSLAVGLVWLPQLCRASAGTWDLINGGPATALPRLFDGPATRANAVNADGSVIVGWQDQPTGERTAAKWVNGVEELILTPSGGFNGEAHGGERGRQYNRGRRLQLRSLADGAWIWRPATGVQRIGKGRGSELYCAGCQRRWQNRGRLYQRRGSGRHERAFIWRDGRGVILLTKYLADHGVVVPEGWDLNVASIISADGTTVYGWGFNPDNLVEMFKVELK